MLNERLRSFGVAGGGVVAGCLWPLFMLVLLFAVSWGLWEALGWPSWILGLGFVLWFFGGDLPFFLLLFVAVVAGFFQGAWQWSLAVPGLMIFGFVGNIALGRIMHSLEGRDNW